jgi:Leucine-rich repeat (LRR) protein
MVAAKKTGPAKRTATKAATTEAPPDPKALGRVKAKVAAFVEANPDVHLLPPLAERDVVAIEQSIGAPLPAEYRTFLLELASGEEGLRFLTPARARELEPDTSPVLPFPLTTKDAKRLIESTPEGDEGPKPAASLEGRVHGFLTLVDHGCAEYSCLVVTGSERGKVWRSWDMGWSRELGMRGSRRVQLTFLAWLEAWLDENTPPPVDVKADTTRLYLARTLKKGVIPPVVWTGANLESLELGGNGIAELPRQILGLRKLRWLSVWGNALVDVPDWLVDARLASLIMSGNPLRGFPAAVTRMIDLKELQVADAGLTSIPESIGALRSLETLILSGNQLESLPASIGDLAQLRRLGLDRNRLRELPESIGGLQALTLLSITDNRLEELPDAIGRLASLQSLSLKRMPLRRVPDTLGGLAALVSLAFENTEIETLPGSVGDIPNLKTLAVWTTPAFKRLPDGLARTRSLET